jgi:acetyl esterase/lipase
MTSGVVGTVRQLSWLIAALAIGCDRGRSEPTYSASESLSSSSDPAEPTKSSEPGATVGNGGNSAASGGSPLMAARRGHATRLQTRESDQEPFDQPPPAVFQLIKYRSPVGELGAYLTPDPKKEGKRPAIIWVTGGNCNAIGEVWEDADPRNDQTASAFRKAGIVMMFVSFRGGNDNPGVKEGFFGEVDDLLAAREHLANVPYVDADRIFLGGHSTGGTMALLGSEATDRFRAVFSFGPAHDVSFYPPEFVPVSKRDAKEIRLRSPIHWLDGIRSPTFVLEGRQGNAMSIQMMKTRTKNPKVSFQVVEGADYFNVLAPVNRLLASKILADTGPTCQITLTAAELNAAVKSR